MRCYLNLNYDGVECFLFFSEFYLEPLNIHFKTVGYQFGDSKSLHDQMEKKNPFETSGKNTLRNEKTRVIQGQGI